MEPLVELYLPGCSSDGRVLRRIETWCRFFEREQSFLEKQPLFSFGGLRVEFDFERLTARYPPEQPLLQIARDAPEELVPVMACALHSLYMMKRRQALPILVADDCEESQQTDMQAAAEDAHEQMETVEVQLYNYQPILPMCELRASQVGKLLAVRGAIMRVNSVRPLLTALTFTCVKCGVELTMSCKDGRYDPPSACPTDRCRNRYFAPQRHSASTIDWQRVRLQEDIIASEVDGSDSAADATAGDPQQQQQMGLSTSGSNALTIDLELTRSLVDTVVPGDIVTVTGIVKAAPSSLGGPSSGHPSSAADGGRGPGTTSLYMLYIHVTGLVHENNPNKRQGRGSAVGGDLGVSALWKDFAPCNCSGVFSIFASGAPSSGSGGPCGVACAAGGAPLVIDVDLGGGTGGGDDGAGGSYSTDAMETWNPASGGVVFIRDMFYQEPNRFELLVAALCPAIFGKVVVKAALVLSLLGGVAEVADSKDRRSRLIRRGNIHVLLVGDPGIGKSRLLRCVTALSDRGVYVCGSASSTTGLTASVFKESGTGEYALEAGALVLADNGVCCIDELDKMPANDQQAFLEAMEQQTVSVAKAGRSLARRFL
eukprot:GHVT01101840.1.p1 GENE.GHVT01101840.1~~GHVT01101840.1.p1  ORF type:complete len:599 (-),score=148.82 GHVT01101840.1:56-1852(-)